MASNKNLKMPGTKSQIISNAVVDDSVIEPHRELMFPFLQEKDRKQLLLLTCQMIRRKNSLYQERVKIWRAKCYVGDKISVTKFRLKLSPTSKNCHFDFQKTPLQRLVELYLVNL